MSTCIGAIVECGRQAQAKEALARHGVVLVDLAETMWIAHAPSLGNLGVPNYGQALSAELQCDVLCFSIQTTASCEEVVHWRKGEQVRRLNGVDGHFHDVAGTEQAWESSYFFHEEAEDSIDDEEVLARFRKAASKGKTSDFIDVAYAGSTAGLLALLKAKGLSFEKPHGTFVARSAPRTWLLLLGIVVVSLILLVSRLVRSWS